MEKIKKFLDENKSLKILLPVLLLACVFLVVVWANSQGSKKPVVSVNPSQKPTTSQVTPAPNMPGETDTDFFPGSDEGGSSKQTELSPYLGIPKFKGASRSSSNIIWGILEFSNGSVKVKAGDEVGGYRIKSISNDLDSITLEKDKYESVLQITSSVTTD